MKISIIIPKPLYSITYILINILYYPTLTQLLLQPTQTHIHQLMDHHLSLSSFQNTVHTIRSLHILKNSPFQVRFCEPLNNSQLLASKDCISTIKHLNSSKPIPNFNYVVRGTNNFHIALISCVHPILRYLKPPY